MRIPVDMPRHSESRPSRACSFLQLPVDVDHISRTGVMPHMANLNPVDCRGQDLRCAFPEYSMNHIDMISSVPLERMLLASELTLLFVEHDRAFCENVATKIIELQTEFSF